MSRPSRIHCRVIGHLSPEHVHVAIIGSPGVAEGSFSPQPTIRVPVQQVPPDKRFPNSVVWFDVSGDEFIYVEPIQR